MLVLPLLPKKYYPSKISPKVMNKKTSPFSQRD
jgi:hypothetical protein